MEISNPVVEGWYADPEARVYDGKLYLYVTRSLDFSDQHNLDLVVSEDLQRFEIKKGILAMETFVGATFAIWAPTVLKRNGKYYLIFAANNILTDGEIGGLYIGVSDRPDGPFRNVKSDGSPLLNRIINGAQPIDAHLFEDTDGTVYLFYGGWGHLNVAKMNGNMDGFLPFEDGTFFVECTPLNYVEAPCMFKEDNNYYLMWSSGDWTNGSYAVHYSRSLSPIHDICDQGVILSGSTIAAGPGHNGEFLWDGKRYTAYHRHPAGDRHPNHRVLCIDRLYVRDGKILPVEMT